jgi:hypothetical protein
LEDKKNNFVKYPGMKVGIFKRSDGNGGSAFDWSSMWEKVISGLLIVGATTTLNWYINTVKIESRIDRLENTVTKIGKFMWIHIYPTGLFPCPFDDFSNQTKD